MRAEGESSKKPAGRPALPLPPPGGEVDEEEVLLLPPLVEPAIEQHKRRNLQAMKCVKNIDEQATLT